MLKLSDADEQALKTIRRNADMVVEISAWATGYRDCGFGAEAAMRNILASLEREGYLAAPKKKRDKNNG